MSKVLAMIREMGSNRKNLLIIRIITAIILVLILTMGVVFAGYSDDVNKGLSDNLIRLHVIANSDSPADQALKRDVRDVIINYMKTQMENTKDVDQTKQVINKNLKKIEELASAEITRQGKDYPVKAMLGNYPFPTKVYGDITLPSGYYQALRVVIGKGDGANWWCVLFPPLCFVDATHGTISESVKQDLRDALTDEEYNIITSADSEDEIPVKIKFKIVEFFQDSKIKVSSLLSKIF